MTSQVESALMLCVYSSPVSVFVVLPPFRTVRPWPLTHCQETAASGHRSMLMRTSPAKMVAWVVIYRKTMHYRINTKGGGHPLTCNIAYLTSSLDIAYNDGPAINWFASWMSVAHYIEGHWGRACDGCGVQYIQCTTRTPSGDILCLALLTLKTHSKWLHDTLKGKIYVVRHWKNLDSSHKLVCSSACAFVGS